MAAVQTREITVRRPGIEFDPDQPKYFVADDLFRSHIAAMLSSVFPEGEDFFVRSVRHYRDRIEDPELKRQVAGFIGQEAVHGREHRAFNEHLDALGYPTLRVDRITKVGLALLNKTAPHSVQLAVTAGLEHYTATLAETLLRDAAARDEFIAPEVKDLFTWHALEESEHKAVAYDVYQHVSGNYVIRVGTMTAIHVGFFVAMAAAVLGSIARDRTPNKKVLRSLRRLRSHPFFQRDVVRRLADYNRRDFHPDDHQTDDLMVEYREWYDARLAA